MPTLDLFQMYLLVMNVSSFILHALHFIMLRTRGADVVGGGVRAFLSAAGGAAGTMLATLIWDRRTEKGNAWQHVLALTSLVIWGVIYAFIYVRPLDATTFVSKLLVRRDWLYIYVGVMSVVTLLAFGLDKWRAIKGSRRTREATLLALSVLGGSPGGLLGMLIFHHKIRSPQFAAGLPLILVAQLLTCAYLVNAGIL